MPIAISAEVSAMLRPSFAFALSLLSFLLWLPPVGARAQGGEALMGFVKMAQAIDDSRDGQAASKKIAARYQAKLDALKAKEDKLSQKTELFNLDAASLSQSDLDKRRAALEKEAAALQAEFDKAGADLQSEAEKTYGPLYDRAAKIVSDLAAERGLLMVMNTGEDFENAVIFAAANAHFVDLTADVTKALDAGRK
ncbi:MAG: OmpH family outer membrane protein [Deltaproteobacteria bacterium]|nr:OmpH family outer membrane protein [Deltaproteobacteria bacterium]